LDAGGTDGHLGTGIESLDELAHALRQLRRRQARQRDDTELTYRELAARSGYARGVIGDYFTGKVLAPTDRLDVLVVLLGADGEEQAAFATARDRIEERRRQRAAAAKAPEPPAMSFAVLLRQLRADAGLTQEELAEAAGLSRRAISDLERGVSATQSSQTARLLADALGVPVPVRAALEAAAGRGRSGVDELPEPETGAGGVAAATRTLPHDIASFTGRETELRQLTSAVCAGGTVGIHAIGGMAGIGKTAFAVHAAHQLADRFPDGQIFLPLHGHTPGQRPVDPADALASLLLTAGVGASQIPPGLEPRTGMWRDHLAGKRLLLLLDDAAGHEQVRPLLPGTAGSMVLVTSRRHLTALEDARAISLDTLAPAEAAELLIRLVGRPGLGPGDAAVGDITRLCGYLPLAIGMLARQLHHHPGWTAAGLAADLAAARDHRLELMHAENLSVAAAFDLSYQDLSAGQQRLFRRLGLHPGIDIDAYGAAALDGTSLTITRRQLEGLYDQHLLAETAHGRYRFHDLIREHARTLAATDPADERDATIDRVLDYYLHAARTAGRHLGRQLPAAVLVTPPASTPDLSAREDAIAWMDAERLNLHAIAGYAAGHGRGGHAIAIPAAIHGYLRSQGHWDQALALHHTALSAARQAGDRPAEAGALADLGDMQRLTGDFPAATISFTEALQLCRDLGDRPGESSALRQTGVVQRLTGDYPAAAASLARALEVSRDIGDRPGEGSARNELGVVQYLTGDYPAAAASHSRALELCRGTGDRSGEAGALNDLGVVQLATGRYPAAAASFAQALELHRSLGDRLWEANALNNMGVVQQLTGDYPAAAVSHGTALGLYRDLGNRFGEANALNQLGIVQQLTGDYPAAAVSHGTALGLYRDLGNRFGEADAMNQLGIVQHLTGTHQTATASQAQALELYRDLGNRAGEAEVLNSIGELTLASAGPAEAAARHEQALVIATAIASPMEEARALEGIGRCRLHDGQIAAGTGRLLEALAIYRLIGSPRARRVETALRDPGLRPGG
jgi:tetratricopeptide (TPR) repeat protein/transcriptional regulator with XRE-family HTH domain